MSARLLGFWYAFASTRSYPAAMHDARRAPRAGVALARLRLRLGPILPAQGWRESSFNPYPAKGRYMGRDLERLCAKHRLPHAEATVFPQCTMTLRDERLEFTDR